MQASRQGPIDRKRPAFPFLTFRATPAVLPAARVAAWISIAVALVLGAWAGYEPPFDAYTGVAGLLIAAFFLCVVPWLLARWSGLVDRYPRGLLALGLADTLLMLVVLPVITNVAALPTLVLLVVTVVAVLWMLVLRVRIWTYLTGQDWVRCLLLAVLLLGLETAAQYSLG